jgi:hypothetical protein
MPIRIRTDLFKGEGKQFFFEKKNQKTFVCYGLRFAFNAYANGQKFLLLFSKRSAFLLTAHHPQRGLA